MSTPMPAMNPVQPTVLFTMPAPGTKTEEQKHKSKLRGLAVRSDPTQGCIKEKWHSGHFTKV